VSHAFDAHSLPIGETPIDRLVCFDERIGAEIPVREIRAAVGGGFRPHFGWPDVRAVTNEHAVPAEAAG
jgi:hypothetical protein